ncbi:hypothetical protein SEPCBS119000_001360 [Sporothrix epigloea]|uniref:Nucleic acid-binding, OB-fold protein n=1 Tax=Sporothrix epigloea TaxID=1892477 RepID=A0ABP0DBC8_9PEZI
MGRVTILAGAPDAATLDFSDMMSRPEMGTRYGWKGRSGRNSIDFGNIGASDHPLWRVVSRGIVDDKARTTRLESQATESSDTSQASAVYSAHHPYGKAESQASTGILAGCWDRGSSGASTLSSAQASMPFCLPGALDETAPRQQQPRSASTIDDDTDAAANASLAFLEHSLAVHDALPSSVPRLDLPSLPVSQGAFVVDETTLSFSQSVSICHSLPPLPATLPPWQPLLHLANVPSPAYLLSLAPQTVTVNVVVAVVSIGSPRIVESTRTKNSNGCRNRPPAELVELVVGDETSSGFSVTIWLDGAGTRQGGTLTTAAILRSLAPHDVILIRHLALHVFGTRVYGSSLRRDQTRLHVLHRGRLSRPQQIDGPVGSALFSPSHLAAAASLDAQTVSSLPLGWQLLEKTARVRNWALRCVLVDNKLIGDGATGAGQEDIESREPEAGVTSAPTWMLPPADTQ